MIIIGPYEGQIYGRIEAIIKSKAFSFEQRLDTVYPIPCSIATSRA